MELPATLWWNIVTTTLVWCTVHDGRQWNTRHSWICDSLIMFRVMGCWIISMYLCTEAKRQLLCKCVRRWTTWSLFLIAVKWDSYSSALNLNALVDHTQHWPHILLLLLQGSMSHACCSDNTMQMSHMHEASLPAETLIHCVILISLFMWINTGSEPRAETSDIVNLGS